MLIIARSVTSASTSRFVALGEISVDLTSHCSVSCCIVGGKVVLLPVFYVEMTYDELRENGSRYQGPMDEGIL